MSAMTDDANGWRVRLTPSLGCTVWTPRNSLSQSLTGIKWTGMATAPVGEGAGAGVGAAVIFEAGTVAVGVLAAASAARRMADLAAATTARAI
jgi:hypothetical protein